MVCVEWMPINKWLTAILVWRDDDEKRRGTCRECVGAELVGSKDESPSGQSPQKWSTHVVNMIVCRYSLVGLIWLAWVVHTGAGRQSTGWINYLIGSSLDCIRVFHNA